MKYIFLALFFAKTYAYAGVRVNGENVFLGNILDEVISLLPGNYLSSANGDIFIEEFHPGNKKKISENLCQLGEETNLGYLKLNKIFINSDLIQLAKNNKTHFDCGHGTFLKLLKAVIIHELTHVKDNYEKISLDSEFQRIVGVKKITLNTKKKVNNQAHQVSPDPYEYKNLEESLAVNAEYLILDPEYECRKPASAEYLSKRLGVQLKRVCRKNYDILLQSSFLEDHYRTKASIHPNRVYQIHYLFASKGESLMSRWGHAMFRLIICAPFRTEMSEDCLGDISHHIVLSYRANISDLSINYSSGLTGKYPSQLYLLRYMEVLQEYTKFELRDLISIPLNLSFDQKKDFLNLTIERFWTYQGKYYFLDNNCGTEAVKQLSSVLSESESALIRSTTPLRIYKDIISSRNNFTISGIDHLSTKELKSRGYLVESMFNNFLESYQFLKKIIPLFSRTSFREFTEDLPAEKRLIEYQNLFEVLNRYDANQRKMIIMKIHHIERLLAAKYLQTIPSKVMKFIKRDTTIQHQVLSIFHDLKILSLGPWAVVKSVYGVPSEIEFSNQYHSFLTKMESTLEAKTESYMNNLLSILDKDHFATDLSELTHILKIKKRITDLIILENIESLPRSVYEK
jgi:hypothetical protein